MLQQYRQATRRLSSASAAALLALWAAREAGDVNDEDFVDIGVTHLAASNVKATTLADLALAAVLADLVGRSYGPLGLSRPDDTDRLRGSLTTLLDRAAPENIDGAARAERIGAAEPLTAGREAWSAGMVEHKVAGWTRVTGGNACPFCRSLADGSVLPASVAMAEHPGCSCSAQPVTD